MSKTKDKKIVAKKPIAKPAPKVDVEEIQNADTTEVVENSVQEDISEAESAAIKNGSEKVLKEVMKDVDEILKPKSSKTKPVIEEQEEVSELQLAAEALMKNHDIEEIFKVGKFWFTRKDYATKASIEKKLSLETFKK